MKRTSKKLAGPSLELFLRRFFSRYPDIDARLARRLSRDSAEAFASVRVRQAAWHDRHRGNGAVSSGSAPAANASAEGDKSQAAPSQATASRGNNSVAAPPADAASTDAPFDPYAIGLVPTYQREGAKGLLARLQSIPSPDNLRKMARSQQVMLAADLRTPDADIDAIRAAIVAAVGKRIADRRAAAG
ncbi:MAG: hypothetical protein KKB37_07410 [Alphaproteobacteria bacterium]|nr:hypothetical protein [Alphaproteobacteria bacterium]